MLNYMEQKITVAFTLQFYLKIFKLKIPLRCIELHKNIKLLTGGKKIARIKVLLENLNYTTFNLTRVKTTPVLSSLNDSKVLRPTFPPYFRILGFSSWQVQRPAFAPIKQQQHLRADWRL